ncbi:MAG TPA: type II CAAX endopeptidase family protein [Terriglobales bacterium]|nr:type II CAAX endopeptidase family protein [Terriglobales bacterium]
MDATTPVPQTQPRQHELIAPVWHTIALIVLLIVFSMGGAKTQPHAAKHAGLVYFYVITMIFEWIIVGYIAWGIRRKRRVGFSELVGGRWSTPEAALLDVAIAVGFWIVSAMVLAGLGYAMGMANNAKVHEMKRQIDFLIPHSTLETVIWILVAVTAGFCEEIIFRGYLQRQLGAIASSIWIGILAQGIVFGLSHGYEGAGRMVLIAVYGVMFGLLAYWRKSLRPGMMAHFMQDSIAGIGARFVH